MKIVFFLCDKLGMMIVGAFKSFILGGKLLFSDDLF